ncbi:MAG: phytase [Capsulimonadales bacterium]|nr:phytase [Capsulimonadales bacterium]
MHRPPCLTLLTLALIVALPSVARTPTVAVTPALATRPVANDPDDPAIWVHPVNPAESRIVGTNKVSATEGGALYVFDLKGDIRQIVRGLDRPNNVDIEYGFSLNGTKTDLVVVTERNTSRIRLFALRPDDGTLSEIAPNGIPVFGGETGDAAAPMGVALYRRPKDGAIFAIVGRKSGPTTGYLWQYRLREDGKGKVTAEKVRAFGNYSGKKEIESIAVDDDLGFVYYSDEGVGVRKYAADPDAPDPDRELARFATADFKGDHEGIALYPTGPKSGYLICTDQIPAADGGSVYRVFTREGEPGNPHAHREIARWNGGADETDGIEITARRLGDAFPAGILVAMNSGPKNFLIFDARKLINTLTDRR